MVKVLYLKWVGFDSSLPGGLDGVKWMNHRRMLWSNRHDYYSQEGKDQRLILWVMSHHPSSQPLLILKLKSKTELEATGKSALWASYAVLCPLVRSDELLCLTHTCDMLDKMAASGHLLRKRHSKVTSALHCHVYFFLTEETRESSNPLLLL